RAAGAVPVGQASSVAAGADVVCVCVFSDDQVKEICLGEDPSESAPSGDSPSGDRRSGDRPSGDSQSEDSPSAGAPSRGALLAAMPEGSVLVLHTTGSPR